MSAKVTGLYQTKAGIWRADKVIKGRRYPQTLGRFDTEAAAIEAFESWKTAIERHGNIMLHQAGTDYWIHARHLPSARTTDYQLKRLYEFFGENKPLVKITMRDVREYVATQMGRDVPSGGPPKPGTINRELELLRRIFRFSKVQTEIDWRKTRKGGVRLDEGPQKTRVLSDDEQERLYAELPDYIKPLFMFALLTGQRKNECVTLDWAQVHMDAGYIEITGKGGTYHLLPISGPVMALLGTLGPKDSGRVFTRPAESQVGYKGPSGRVPIKFFDRAWYSAMKRAKVENLCFHDLRHTAASRMVWAGIDLAVVGKVLGHSNTAMTARYAHFRQEDELRALESLNPTPHIVHTSDAETS